MISSFVFFCCREHSGKEKTMTPFTLARFLKRQKVALHGYEERNFFYRSYIKSAKGYLNCAVAGSMISPHPTSLIRQTSYTIKW